MIEKKNLFRFYEPIIMPERPKNERVDYHGFKAKYDKMDKEILKNTNRKLQWCNKHFSADEIYNFYSQSRLTPERSFELASEVTQLRKEEIEQYWRQKNMEELTMQEYIKFYGKDLTQEQLDILKKDYLNYFKSKDVVEDQKKYKDPININLDELRSFKTLEAAIIHYGGDKLSFLIKDLITKAYNKKDKQ